MASRARVELPLETLRALDRAVARGRFGDRSEALAAAIDALLSREGRRQRAHDLVRSYEQHPEEEQFGEFGLRLLSERLRPGPVD